MIEQDIRDFLRDVSAITDRVSTRIYPSRVPIGVDGESIVLREISAQPAAYKVAAGEVGLHEKRCQVDCYAASPKAAFTLSELVRDSISGYRSTIGDAGTTQVEAIQIEFASSSIEEPERSSDVWIHRYQITLSMFVSATVPSLST